jgi:hypothetical protein
MDVPNLRKSLSLIFITIFSIDGVSTKMHQNNVFTVAKRNLEGQDMIYQAIKFTNNVWALTELKIQPGNPNITVIYYQMRFVLKFFMGQSKFYL